VSEVLLLLLCYCPAFWTLQALHLLCALPTQDRHPPMALVIGYAKNQL
jgi:hypothetical protein